MQRVEAGPVESYLAGNVRGRHLVEVAKDHAAGVFSGTNDLVKTITEKEPMGLREFVEKKRLFETGNAPKVIAMT